MVAFRRDPEGRVKADRIFADYAVFVPAAELPADLVRKLGHHGDIAGIKRDGEHFRISFRDAMVRDFWCRRDKSPFVQNSIQTCEGDVDPVRRWLVDASPPIAKPRACYLDIETDSRLPFSQKHKMRILCWTIVGADDGEASTGVLDEDTKKDERRLLEEMWAALERYDQVIAWNGDGFDFEVIAERTKACNMQVERRRWLWLDHMDLFRRMNMHAAESGDEKQSMSLQSIAMAVVGEGKDDFDASKTWEAWAAGGEERARMVRYNVKDTVLLRRIEQATGYVALFGTLCEVCRLFGDSSAINPTKQMDGYMLALGAAKGARFPTKQWRDNALDRRKYKGAYVMDPRTRGIEKNVHVADFASLYPSIILTWNMSPDTKVVVPKKGPPPKGVCRLPTGSMWGFATGAEGILPTALREMIRMRKRWADEKAALPPGTPEWHDADRKSTAYKVAANSFYGVVGSPFSRFYDESIAEGITQSGRWLLERTIAEAEAKGHRVVYADTDSLYVTDIGQAEFGAFVDWCNAELYPRLLAELGCAENKIKLAYEKAFERIVFASAKKYAARFAHYKGKAAQADSKPEIKGLEYKRGDALLIARRLQAEVIDLLCGGLRVSAVPGPTEEVSEYEGAVLRARAHILDDDLPLAEVALHKAIQKPLKEYAKRTKKDGTDAAQPPHVVVAHVLKGRGREVAEGVRISYVVADELTKKYIPAEDYAGECDRHYIWQSLVYPPTMRLLQAAFPAHDWGQWAHTRPPRPRVKGQRVPEGQTALDFGGDLFTRVKTSPDPMPTLDLTGREALDLFVLLARFWDGA